MATVKPLYNRILVKRSEATKSKGGILLPESAQEKPKEGTVVAAGPGKLNEDGSIEPVTVKVGDRVLFSTYAGTEVTLDDETLLIIAEDDLLGILS